MTLGGAIYELRQMRDSPEIPVYFRSTIQHIIETVEDEKRTAEWIINDDGVLMCSYCEEYALQRMRYHFKAKTFDCIAVPSRFCPNCGAIMLNGKSGYWEE